MTKGSLLVCASLFVLGFVTPAAAADLTARPYAKAPMIEQVYDWSGLYLGINAGGGWSHSSDDWNNSQHSSGGTVGGQIGYRWQAANWVFGVEAQGNWAEFGKNDDWNHVNSFGLFTGQVGYAWNNVLWYVKGGGAVVHNDWKWNDGSRAYGGFGGGTVGTGVDIGFAPNWSVGVEYNHIFMGSQRFEWGGVVAPATVKQDIDVVLVRLNYKFGGPVVARY